MSSSAVPTADRLAGGTPVTASGDLIIIGGHEEKEGRALILREVARRVGSGKLVVATIASHAPGEMWRDYELAFTALGVRRLEHLDVSDREALLRDPRPDVLADASVVFFTGGGQLRITTLFGGTELCERVQEFYRQGGTIAGTSAGASVMSDTMLVSGDGDESHRVGGQLLMAPGLGYIKDVIVDQHFAERGRIGRLLGAVGQNPRLLGVGLDENTAIVVEGEVCFRVIGAGAVYVVDGRGVTSTNLTDEDNDRAMSIFNVRLHVLSQGDEFDLRTREPIAHSAEEAEKHLAGADGSK
ncbi:MAG TPA: cyanophycinase [Gemmatimonadales bacterium]|nr:cyanophycinase [Gemmatimonadales bacterium]